MNEIILTVFFAYGGIHKTFEYSFPDMESCAAAVSTVQYNGIQETDKDHTLRSLAWCAPKEHQEKKLPGLNE